jgi:hypothetical protein
MTFARNQFDRTTFDQKNLWSFDRYEPKVARQIKSDSIKWFSMNLTSNFTFRVNSGLSIKLFLTKLTFDQIVFRLNGRFDVVGFRSYGHKNANINIGSFLNHI